MAKSCGIHIGQRRFAVVVLDGTAKKHKVVFQVEGEIPPGEDYVQTTSHALKEAAKRVRVSGENIGLAVDSGLAAYRTLSLPFDERSKIEDVVKFEVESQLPQWDIDDVVVDFLILSATPGVESNLLVTAVPKEPLRERIRACERAGLEPYEAELDTTALFNAAHQSGVLHEAGAQILVHVGDTSTSVVVVDGGRLKAMRSIHTGATDPAPAAKPQGEGAQAEATPETEAAPAAPPVEADPAAAAQRRAESARRLRRELARTISGARTENPIDGIYVTGLKLPELFEGPIFDIEVRPFAELPGVAEGAGEYAVAYGAALRRLGGGVLRGTLRREELRYTGKFERLELPLAVLCLVLLMSLWVHLRIVNLQILWGGEGDLERGFKGDMQIWLEASNHYMLPSPEDDTSGRLTLPPENIAEFCRKAEAGELEVTKMQQLRGIEALLTDEIKKVKKQLGQVSEGNLKQPQSALTALTTVLEVMDEMGDDLGRFGLRQITAETAQTRQNSPDHVVVKFDIDLFGADDLEATRHYENFAKAIRAQPWCIEFDDKASKVLDSGDGVYADGVTIKVDTELIPKEGAEGEEAAAKPQPAAGSPAPAPPAQEKTAQESAAQNPEAQEPQAKQ